MELNKLDFANKVQDQTIYDLLFNNYELLGKDWIAHQWTWINAVYQAFEDHIKFLIIISLVEKTLNFYHQINITKTYDEYYCSNYLQIEKYSITELCEKLDLPKETIRRKVLELEKEGVIKRDKKKIYIMLAMVLSNANTINNWVSQIHARFEYLSCLGNYLYEPIIECNKKFKKYRNKKITIRSWCCE